MRWMRKCITGRGRQHVTAPAHRQAAASSMRPLRAVFHVRDPVLEPVDLGFDAPQHAQDLVNLTAQIFVLQPGDVYGLARDPRPPFALPPLLNSTFRHAPGRSREDAQSAPAALERTMRG